MKERNPPFAPDLTGIAPGYTWKFGASAAGAAPPAELPATTEDREAEIQHLRAQVQQLRAALEDVVAFALSSADYKNRAIMMHRRAVAALTDQGGRPPTSDSPAQP